MSEIGEERMSIISLTGLRQSLTTDVSAIVSVRLYDHLPEWMPALARWRYPTVVVMLRGGQVVELDQRMPEDARAVYEQVRQAMEAAAAEVTECGS